MVQEIKETLFNNTTEWVKQDWPGRAGRVCLKDAEKELLGTQGTLKVFTRFEALKQDTLTGKHGVCPI